MCNALVSLASAWLSIANYVIALVALGLVGLSTYLIVTAASLLTYFMMGIAVYFLVVSLMGVCTSRGYASVGFLYVVLFSILLIFEGVVVCGFLFAKDKTLELFKDMDTTNGHKVEEYLKAHLVLIEWCALGFLVLQVASVILAACCRDRIAAKRRPRTDSSMAPTQPLLDVTHDGYDDGRSKKPASDAQLQRQAIAEKWGLRGDGTGRSISGAGGRTMSRDHGFARGSAGDTGDDE